MSKQAFLLQLRKGLSGLPEEDIEERLTFYSEMIDDRMEEGHAEEDAVSAVGSVEEIVAQTIADIPFAKIAKERIKPQRRWTVWEIVLLALGSPVWLSLAVTAVAVVLSLYASLWAVIVSLWAVFFSVASCAVGGILAGIGKAAGASFLTGTAMMGAGIVCAGLAIFLFFGCKAATTGTLTLTKNLALGMKTRLIKKEGAQ